MTILLETYTKTAHSENIYKVRKKKILKRGWYGGWAIIAGVCLWIQKRIWSLILDIPIIPCHLLKHSREFYHFGFLFLNQLRELKESKLLKFESISLKSCHQVGYLSKMDKF